MLLENTGDAIYVNDPLQGRVLPQNRTTAVGTYFALVALIVQILFVPFFLYYRKRMKAKPEIFDSFAVLFPSTAMLMAHFFVIESNPTWGLVTKYLNWIITGPMIVTQFLRLLDAEHLTSYFVFCDLNIKSAGFLGVFLEPPYNWIVFGYGFSFFTVLVAGLSELLQAKEKKLQKEPSLLVEYRRLALLYVCTWTGFVLTYVLGHEGFALLPGDVLMAIYIILYFLTNNVTEMLIVNIRAHIIETGMDKEEEKSQWAGKNSSSFLGSGNEISTLK